MKSPHYTPIVQDLYPSIRKKQMIKYKGTTIYPPAMYDLLNDFSEVKSYIIEIDNSEIGTDNITIKLCSNISSDAISNELMSDLKDHFRAKLRVSPTIKFVSTDEINRLKFPKMSRKPVLFIDKRE